MMDDCRRTIDRLPSYVDGELAEAQRAELERHIAVCAPCRHAAVAERGGRTVLREKADGLTAEPLPPGLRARCEALAREHTRPARAAWMTRLVPVSLSAMLVLFTGLAVFSLATYESDTVLAAQLTADHAKCFRIFAEPGSPDADAAQLERMLLDEYGWKVRVPPSSPADGVQLIGARRCLYADGRLPHVMYRVGSEDVSLYMLEGVARPAAEVTALGHRSRIWSSGNTTYVLVSQAGGSDLARAERYVMQEAH